MSVFGLIAGTVISGLLSSRSANKAAKAQESAADKSAGAQREAIAEQQRQFDLARGDLAPYRQAGYNALGQMQGMLGMPGAAPVDFSASPGYQFRLDAGQQALDRAAAARGMSLSSGTMKDFQRYGQGLASDEYWNQYNALAGISNSGQGAVNAGVQAGQNTANSVQTALGNIGSAYQQAGQARASGYAGQNQALQGTMGNLFSIYSMNQAGAFGQPPTPLTGSQGGFMGKGGLW